MTPRCSRLLSHRPSVSFEETKALGVTMTARRETAEVLSEQILRHQALERDLERMQESHAGRDCPILAQVVMEECREAKIRRQNKQIVISVGISIGLIVAVIWFVVSR